jgi:TonB family protein
MLARLSIGIVLAMAGVLVGCGSKTSPNVPAPEPRAGAESAAPWRQVPEGQFGAGAYALRKDVQGPTRIHFVAPVYPAPAREGKQEGSVIVEAIVGKDGSVRDARIMRSVAPALDQSALAAVRQWKYTPVWLNGGPAELVVTITVAFKLQ